MYQMESLLAHSRFLVTEQAASTEPVTPPLDTATWRYQAAIPTVPNPADEQHHYTVLDHLRHLLAKDPTVASIGLAGGLNIWLYRNSLEVMEEATTARDYWQYKTSTAYMHRQIVRILDYLDGYNDALRDVPLVDPITHSEPAFLIDRKYGELGLLTLDEQQQPPGGRGKLTRCDFRASGARQADRCRRHPGRHSAVQKGT
jgi:hypothetical protein